MEKKKKNLWCIHFSLLCNQSKAIQITTRFICLFENTMEAPRPKRKQDEVEEGSQIVKRSKGDIVLNQNKSIVPTSASVSCPSLCHQQKLK